MPWTRILSEQHDIPLDKREESGNRVLSYTDALNEALRQALINDERVYIMGQGVDDPCGCFGVTRGLKEDFGEARVFDTPISENSLTGIAVGSALAGMRPVYCHNRPDFLLLAMDQIVNHASKWSYMFGGNANVPLVIWSVIARGWGSGAQHSQALHGLFMHIPGLKLAMPTTPYDAKGLMLSAIADDNPVIILEHKWLFKQSGNVPKELYAIPFGKGVVRKYGSDITIVAISYMVAEALIAARELEREGISAEVIDLRTLKPLDLDIIESSVAKTGRLIVADIGWKSGGVSAEIVASVSEKYFHYLKTGVKRVACEDVPTPAGYTLEEGFYKGKTDIYNTAVEMMRL